VAQRLAKALGIVGGRDPRIVFNRPGQGSFAVDVQ
jgi:hypothetical protein